MRITMNSGAQVAAFFDIDGTLLALPSLERRLLRYLRWRGALTATHGARWLGRFLWRVWSDWLAATEGNKAHLAGISVATVEPFAALLGRRQLEFFPEALRRLEWHWAQGHKIFLISGTLAPLTEAVARQLPPEVTTCATQLEAAGGRCTGEVVGEAVCGPGKAHALERLAAEHQLDLGRSYAYSDSWNDRWMLDCVGHPAAVNPSRRLARLARKRGWPVLLWRETAWPERHGGAAARLRKDETASTSRNSSLAALEIAATAGRRK